MRHCIVTVFRFALIAALQVAVPRTAAAQPTVSSNDAEARARFNRGLALYNSQDYPGALAEFQAAYDLSHRPNVLFNLGVTLRALHRYPEAVRAIEQFLNTPLLPADRRQQVERGLAEIRALIAHVTIRGVPAGALISMDGERIGTAPLREPMVVGTGLHTIEVSGDGLEPVRQTFTIAGGQSRELITEVRPRMIAIGSPSAALSLVTVSGLPALAKLEIDGRPSSPERTLPVPPGSHEIRVRAEGFRPYRGRVDLTAGGAKLVRIHLAKSSPLSPLPFALCAGATVAFGTTAGTFGALSLGTLSEFNRLVREDPRAPEIAARGSLQQTVANGFLAGAILAGAATAALFFWTRFGPSESTATVALAPRPDGGDAVVYVRF